MTPKDIVVFVEDVEGSFARVEFAAALAMQWRAHLSAVFVPDALELHRFSGFAVGTGLAHMLAQHGEQVRAAEARYRRMFDEALSDRGLDGEWRISQHAWGEDLMLHARHADLAIVGPADGPSRRKTILSLSEDMIFASGRPTLLVPNGWQAEYPPANIALAWNSSAEASRAVAGALPLLAAATRVDIIIAPGAGLPVHEKFDSGKALVGHLARHGISANLSLLEGRDAGAAILGFVDSFGSDLLVMGAYGHSKLNETIFGGATRYVLQHAKLPVLLSR
jgi:nucleotide-binding universal stress UspA family protein